MIRLLLLIIFSAPTFAKTYIVEIADFSCKYCYEAEHYTHKLRLDALKNGDEFIFAPYVFNKGSKAEELLYYAVNSNENIEPFIRNAMFDLKQNLRLNIGGIDELIDWLDIYHGKDAEMIASVKHAVSENQQNLENIKAYLKAANLIKKHEIKSTPTFLLIDDSANISVVKKPEKMPVPEYIDHVLDMYKRISKNED